MSKDDWEVFKGGRYPREKTVRLTKNGKLLLSKDIGLYLKGERITLMINKNTKEIGMKSSTSVQNTGYKIQSPKRSSWDNITIKSFLRHYNLILPIGVNTRVEMNNGIVSFPYVDNK